ncbi:Sodium/glucose cotransporter [Novipirellula galeiformis]|uniref:Sodium/glucose cotransporter n=1 Tax=Novipirellula galeiformis TaxID=2528004 RepID=A0A5C6C1D3_9BACT|nr:sodium:solute symporter [Novipirellula galeiformis]TWU17777.1 Sodium/glucose cotransporter [Novipirellula galeiformis]
MAISSIDAAILVLYMLIMVALGLWVGRDQKDLSGYLLGGRDLPWWAILGSIVATETSTATFLSVPGIAFAADGDMRFLQLAFGFLVGRVIVAIVLVPLYCRGEIFTAYEILQQRFGGASKKCASLLFLITRNLGDGLRLFLAGIALEKVLGIDLHLCIAVIGIATIVYTFFGGMKAVIWSDCIQLVVYMVGGFLALKILVGFLPGGWSELFEFGNSTGRFHILDFRWQSTATFNLWSETYTFWSGLIGGAVLTLGTHGTDQMFVQRYLCARSGRDAQRAVIASGFVVFAQFALFLLLGVALAAYYTNVDPQTFAHNDEVFATFIVDHLPIGLVGITLAAVFAAAMSTLSSSLNSSAAAAVSDFYAPWAYPEVGDDPSHPDHSDKLLLAGRSFTIIFGILQIAIGMGASYVSRSVVGDALAIAGFTAGILLGVFGLGMFTRSAHQRGALVGMVCGIAVLTGIKFGTTIAWPWYAIIGSLTTFVCGYLASQLISPLHAPAASTVEDDSMRDKE